MWKADICWELNPGFLVWAIVHYYWAMTARQQPALTILCTKCLSHTSSSHACMHVLIVLTTDQMVTMVAYKLERQSLWEVCFGMSIRQPRKQLTSSSYNHNTLTTLRTSAESLQMHFKVALRNLLLMQAGDSHTDVLRVVSCGCEVNWAAASQVALCN